MSHILKTNSNSSVFIYCIIILLQYSASIKLIIMTIYKLHINASSDTSRFGESLHTVTVTV